MKVGDLVITKQCVWYYGSEAKERRIGIILEMIEAQVGMLVNCWFEHIGHFQINIEGIELLEDSC